jgi:hypothetical protein
VNFIPISLRTLSRVPLGSGCVWQRSALDRIQKPKKFISKSNPTFLHFTSYQPLLITIQIKKITTKQIFSLFIQNILTFFPHINQIYYSFNPLPFSSPLPNTPIEFTNPFPRATKSLGNIEFKNPLPRVSWKCRVYEPFSKSNKISGTCRVYEPFLESPL